MDQANHSRKGPLPEGWPYKLRGRQFKELPGKKRPKPSRPEAFDNQLEIAFGGYRPAQILESNVTAIGMIEPERQKEKKQKIRSFNDLEDIVIGHRTAKREAKFSGSERCNRHSLAQMLEELVDACPPALTKRDDGQAMHDLRTLAASLNQLHLIEEPPTPVKPPTPSELQKINDLLNGAVVHASDKATVLKFGKAWLKLQEDGPVTRELAPLAAYFTYIKRPAGLSILEKQCAKLRTKYNTLVLLKPEEKTAYEQRLAQIIDDFFTLVPANEDPSLRSTKPTLQRLREMLTYPLPLNLFDGEDLVSMKETVKHHFKGDGSFANPKGLLRGYEQSIGAAAELLDDALNNKDNPAHRLAKVLYNARWAQIAETLQHEIMRKVPRIMPGFSAEPSVKVER